MAIKSDEFKAAISVIRERIATAKRRGTHSGFIDYYGCITVTNEFIEILEDADKSASRGEYALAYSIAALILINLAKLASSADDSAGGVTDTKGYVEDVLEKVCSGVEYGSAEAEFIFLQSIKDSQNKAFDGWDEFAYDLLQPTARLVTDKNIGKLYALLDEFSAKLSRKEYSAWHLERDCLVRLAAITSVNGESSVEKFIADNLKFDGIRRIAIRKAIDKTDFTHAEMLCLNKINTTDRDYHWTREWYDMLFEVYIKMGDKVKQSDIAKDLLVNKRDTKYYGFLKVLLTENGSWENEYPLLLANLSQNLPYHLYMEILSKEREMQLLINELRKHPSEIFTYGKQLSVKFPSDTYTLCLDEIRKQAAEADNRIKYKKVCGAIKKLFEFGGVNEAQIAIAELKSKYPRRPAMIEELNALGVKLSKKKK